MQGAATQVVDGDVAALFFMQAVGQSRCGRLVDEAQDFESGDFASVLRGLALRVVEVRGNSDNGAISRFAEMSFRPVFQCARNDRRDVWGRESLTAELHANEVLAERVDAKWKKLQFVL